MQPTDNGVKNILNFERDAEDVKDLPDILPFCLIAVQSTSCDNFSIKREKCHLYGLGVAVNTTIIFWTSSRELYIAGEHWEALERVAEVQSSVQDPKAEMTRFCKANSIATSSREIYARLEKELADVSAETDINLITVQTLTNDDWYMPH